MPCNSDHMKASSQEVELGKVYLLLDELDGKELTDVLWDSAGYDKRVYDISSKVTLDKQTALLCSKLKKVKDIKKYSLEMQMWWRDHQKADKMRLEAEKREKEKLTIKQKALDKLTSAEKRALGL